MTAQRRRDVRWARWLSGALLLVACGVDAVGAIPDVTSDGGPDGSVGPGPGPGAGMDASPNNVDLDGATNGGDAEGDASKDATLDVALDASPDVMVDAAADAALDAAADAAFDAGVLFDCNGQLRASCAGCPNKPLPCFMCRKGGGTPATLCVAHNSSCIQLVDDDDYDWCPCDFPSATKCPLREQVCHSVSNGSCVTCGENLTNGFQCKEANKKCNQAQDRCE